MGFASLRWASMPSRTASTRSIGSRAAPGKRTPSASLPLPPFLDPERVAARRGSQRPKKKPTNKNLTSLQKAVQQNPYAYALQTPLRLDAISGTRLPSFFLLGFNFCRRPDTSRPWVLPDYQALYQSKRFKLHGLTEEGLTRGNRGPDARTLARQSHIHQVGRKKTTWQRMFALVDMQKKGVEISDAVWREDMDVYILQRLRGNVRKTLEDVVGRGEYINAWSGENQTLPPTTGCMLWFREDSEGHQQGTARACPDSVCSIVTTGEPPSQTSLPAYNLSRMLGEDWNSLQRKPWWGDLLTSARACVMMGTETVGLQMALWQLKVYVEGAEEYLLDRVIEEEEKELKMERHLLLRRANWERRAKENETGVEPKRTSDEGRERTTAEQRHE